MDADAGLMGRLLISALDLSRLALEPIGALARNLARPLGAEDPAARRGSRSTPGFQRGPSGSALGHPGRRQGGRITSLT
jgi:hypothetical protein